MGDVGSLASGGLAGLACSWPSSPDCSSWRRCLCSCRWAIQADQADYGHGGAESSESPHPPPLRAPGLDEVTVGIRFWIIAGICVATGLAIFHASTGHGDLPRAPTDSPSAAPLSVRPRTPRPTAPCTAPCTEERRSWSRGGASAHHRACHRYTTATTRLHPFIHLANRQSRTPDALPSHRHERMQCG